MPLITLPVQPRQFLILWFLAIGWVLLVATASALYRVHRGRYILRPQVPNAVFSETWASGRSYRSLLTRLGGANRCLWVAVTPDELLVGPHFPFSLFFLPEIYGLEYRASGAEIASVELRQSLFGRQRAVVHLRTGEAGRVEAFELDLKDVAGFAAAVENLRQASAPSHPRVPKELG